jgi:Lrp/AsnC family transcriptional regulator, regulator for asnA, asnC and gidA
MVGRLLLLLRIVCVAKYINPKIRSSYLCRTSMYCYMTKSINKRSSTNVAGVQAATTTSTILDDSDLRIIKLLVASHNNQQIANETKIPLSTIQRKTRMMFEKEYVISRNEINYKKLGFRRGLIHIYLNHGDLKQIATRVTKMDSVQTVSMHAGNSDIIGVFLYNKTEQVLGLIDEVKKMEGVDSVVWSEEVYTFPQTDNTSKMFVMHDELR